MILRGLLICSVGIGSTSLMIGTFATAIAQKEVAGGELGSCAGYSGLPSEDNDTAGMVFIRGGTFVMGSDHQRPEERFTHIVRVDGFWIDRHEVTNAQFREFVTATGYVTLAERGLDPATHPGMPKELLAPGAMVFVPPTNVASGGRIMQWWQYTWRARIGGHRPVREVRLLARTIIPSSKSPTKMRSPMRVGVAASCRPRRNGSSPRAAAATARTTGPAPSTPRASLSPIP